jgi:hypothetical protein
MTLLKEKYNSRLWTLGRENMTQTNTGLHGPTIITTKKNIVLDATLLSALMGCGRLVDLRFNHNLQSIRGKSNSLEVGSIVHKGLEINYKMRSAGYDRLKSEAMGLVAARLYADGCPYCADFVATDEILTPACGHSPQEYPGVANTPEESSGYIVGIKHAIDTLEQYFDYYKGDHWITLGVETVEGKVLYEDDDIRILWKAKLDWKVDTNQGIFAVDHKTAKQRRPKQKLNNQFMGQCLVTGARSMIVNEIGFQKTLKPHEKFQRPMMNYTSEALIEWSGTTLPYWAYKLLDYQETGYWPPNLTHCENKYGNCPFIPACEADPHMRAEELKIHFIKGPAWDPTNPTILDED